MPQASSFALAPYPDMPRARSTGLRACRDKATGPLVRPRGLSRYGL